MSAKEAILQRIIDLLRREFKLSATVEGQTSFEDLDLDSLDIMRLLFLVEEEFEFKFPENIDNDLITNFHELAEQVHVPTDDLSANVAS